MSIRDYIIENFKDEDIEGINSAIEDSIEEQDEMTLPGLGVLFEMLWRSSTKKQRDSITEKVYKSIKKEAALN